MPLHRYTRGLHPRRVQQHIARWPIGRRATTTHSRAVGTAAIAAAAVDWRESRGIEGEGGGGGACRGGVPFAQLRLETLDFLLLLARELPN